MTPDAATAILVDGRPAAAVDARDRGLHYGDGVFETIACIDGAPEYWEAHLARLARGCGRLGIPLPDGDRLAADARRLCAGHSGDSVLKVIVTRGAGARGYRTAVSARPVSILLHGPWPAVPPRFTTAGVAVRVCDLRLARQPALAGIKHLNRLEQVLARREWTDDTWQEGVLCDAGGRVIEGIASNLFLVQGGRLVTPDLSDCGVAGIVRGRLLAIAGQAGFAAEVRPVPLEELHGADEIFLTNSLIGIWPVTRLEGRRLAVGPATRRLMDLLREDLAHGRG
jgi:4-amino-4-deoxychorismate lyase